MLRNFTKSQGRLLRFARNDTVFTMNSKTDYYRIYEMPYQIALRLRSGQRFASLAMTRNQTMN
jgi:hypothetical protein